MSYIIVLKKEYETQYFEFNEKNNYNQVDDLIYNYSYFFEKNDSEIENVKIYDVGDIDLSNMTSEDMEVIIEDTNEEKCIYALDEESLRNYEKTIDFFDDLNNTLTLLQSKGIIGDIKLTILNKVNDNNTENILKEYIKGEEVTVAEYNNLNYFQKDVCNYIMKKVEKMENNKLKKELLEKFKEYKARDNEIYEFNRFENYMFQLDKKANDSLETSAILIGDVNGKKYAINRKDEYNLYKNSYSNTNGEDYNYVTKVFDSFAKGNSIYRYYEFLEHIPVEREKILEKTSDIREKAIKQAKYLKNAMEKENLEDIKNDIISNALKYKNFLKGKFLLGDRNNEVDLNEISEPILETAIDFFNTRFYNLSDDEKENFIKKNSKEITAMGIDIKKENNEVLNEISNYIFDEINSQLDKIRKKNLERYKDSKIDLISKEWNINLNDFNKIAKEYQEKESGIIYKEQFFLKNVYALTIIDNKIDYKFEEPEYVSRKFAEKLIIDFDYWAREQFAVFKDNKIYKLEEKSINELNKRYEFYPKKYEDTFLKEVTRKYEKENEKAEQLAKAVKEYFEK